MIIPEEIRNNFKGMVVAELEAGFLRYSRRQELMSIAAKLSISEFDAGLLIAEAQYHADEIEPTPIHSPAIIETLTRPKT